MTASRPYPTSDHLRPFRVVQETLNAARTTSRRAATIPAGDTSGFPPPDATTHGPRRDELTAFDTGART
jgi:hypothetical protein